MIVHDEIVRRKLQTARPRILAQNASLAAGLLKEVSAVVAVDTPLGPGHFGYHGRDTLRVEVKSRGAKTIGQLKAAVQLGWRERGTSRGEKAHFTAKKALAAIKRYISFYYGGMTKWWKL